MSGERARLQELADQALRDLAGLDRQVDDGEIPDAAAAGLRDRYETTAARALAALDTAEEHSPSEPRKPRRSRGRLAAYALTAIAAVIAAAVLLPLSVGERPEGGFVTGNELGASAAPPLSRDPATISNAELETVVADNPGVIGMRLALAQRFTEQGDYERAAEHYAEALRRDPGNPAAQAHFGWLLLQVGRPVEAMEWVDRALDAAQPPLDALWFKANIALHGLDDPNTALATLERMRQRDLPPTVAQQVDKLAAVARQRQEEAGR
ncbi:MAG: tetratricopeptide repeat protein [Pseudonocardiaceae bacterium]|nr:tetratricopeptide repeat protein [Pseudonocardiaceae bacterium]